MPQRTDQHPLDRAVFCPRAVAVAEIDRESSLVAEGDDGGVVDLKKRSSAVGAHPWPVGLRATLLHEVEVQRGQQLDRWVRTKRAARRRSRP